MITKTERVKCILCKSTSFKDDLYYPDDDNKENSLGLTQIKICSNCGLGMAHPAPSQKDLDQFYSSGAYWDNSHSSEVTLAHQNIQSHFRMADYRKVIEGRVKLNFLEIGSGYGSLIALFFKENKDLVSTYFFIEPDNEAARATIELVCDERLVRVSSADDISIELDVVITNHVLEHVVSPLDFLCDIAKKLKPKGLLFVETPHYDFNFKDSVFPHTLFFNEKTFKFMSDKFGLKLQEIKTFGSSRCIKKSTRKLFLNRLRGKLFHMSVGRLPFYCQKLLNNKIFDYDKTSDEIWISGVWVKP